MKNKQKIVGSVIILLILVTFLIVGIFINRPKNHKVNEDDIFVESNVESINSEPSEKVQNKSITVCIQGEVNKPGVYSLKSGSIIEDLIKIAGGFTENANSSGKLNLAKKLKDEDYIFIEKKSDNLSLNETSKTLVSNNAQDSKININTASEEELDKIPGIGPITAQKIVDYRNKNGQFNSIEDLKKVGGIGDKTINKFRDKVDIR